LPLVTDTGVYQYSMTVTGGETYFLDPAVAVGYSFAIGAGNPNFASVILPAVQADPFDLSFVWEGITYHDNLLPETLFSFPSGGVSGFTVTGIHPSVGLDPANTTAFITGVTFVNDGAFTGTQTPITIDVSAVPEPGSVTSLSSAVLALLALWGLRASRKSFRPL